MNPGNPKTVLVVDDMVENIEILNHLLSKTYKIKAARNGETALKIARTAPSPDIVLLDIKMPEMDGYEVIKRLKEDPETSHIPVIFVTAQGETFDQTRAFALGAADYIIKPVTPEIVLARVATHVALHETQQYLQARVNEEVAKRIEQEKLLLRQSRLAAMGEMMSVITHQWNQPLSVIGTISATLQFSAEFDEINKEDLVKDLRLIDSNLAFMSQTMLDFKDYFKPEKRKKAFRVLDEVQNIVSMLRPVLKSHGIALELSIGDDVTGFGVASEFKQVILNIISNAKDALNERRNRESFAPQITIVAERRGEMSVLKIADNGGGIPPDALEKVFDNYYTTKAQKGTGIGLAMSKMILEDQLHGTIRVVNENDGAAFVLEFPVSETFAEQEGERRDDATNSIIDDTSGNTTQAQ